MLSWPVCLTLPYPILPFPSSFIQNAIHFHQRNRSKTETQNARPESMTHRPFSIPKRVSQPISIAIITPSNQSDSSSAESQMMGGGSRVSSLSRLSGSIWLRVRNWEDRSEWWWWW